MDLDERGSEAGVEERLRLLESTVLELVAALGMLVGELSARDDLALSKPEEVERALDRGWSALVGHVSERPGQRSSRSTG